MKVQQYEVDKQSTEDGREQPYGETLPYRIPGDWFPFIPRVGDCFWYDFVYWKIDILAYEVEEGDHSLINIELVVSYAGLR